MGGSESSLSAIEGYQVARILPNSPAHIAGLVPYFDIIVGMDQMPLDRDHKTQFQSYVTKNLQKAISLSVFNLRVRAMREVSVTPTTNWGGVGVLGCSLNWETAERCVENTWHVVEVFPGSPAAHSDLVPIRDYLLGMQTAEEDTITMFSDSDDFQDRLGRWKAARLSGSPQVSGAILLLVFDSVNNAVKEVPVEMGTHLSLGVDVANGYLHVIPPSPGQSAIPQVKQFHSSAAPAVHTAAPVASAPSEATVARNPPPRAEAAAQMEPAPSPPPPPVPMFPGPPAPLHPAAPVPGPAAVPATGVQAAPSTTTMAAVASPAPPLPPSFPPLPQPTHFPAQPFPAIPLPTRPPPF